MKVGDILYAVVSNLDELKGNEDTNEGKLLFELSEVEVTHITKNFYLGIIRSNNSKVRIMPQFLDLEITTVGSNRVVGLFTTFVKAEEALFSYIKMNQKISTLSIEQFKKDLTNLEKTAEMILEGQNNEYLIQLAKEFTNRDKNRELVGYEHMNLVLSIHNNIGNLNEPTRQPYLIDINPIYCYEGNKPKTYCFCDYTGEVLVEFSEHNEPSLSNVFFLGSGYVSEIVTYRTIKDVKFKEGDLFDLDYIQNLIKKDLLEVISEHITGLTLAISIEQVYLDKLNTENYYGNLILLS